MPKPVPATPHSDDDPLLTAGYNARELRTKLAASYLTCEAISRQMQSIRAGLVLPARSVLFLESTQAESPEATAPSERVLPMPPVKGKST